MGRHGLGRQIERGRRRAVAALQSSPLFEHVSANDLQRLLDAAERQRFGPDGIIFTAATRADGFYAVLSGQVRSWSADGARLMGQRHAGNCLGEFEMVRRELRQATSIAVDRVEALHVPWSVFDGLLRTSAGFRGAIRAAAVLGEQVEAVTGTHRAVGVECVGFQAPRGFPLTALIESLARAIDALGQRVLVLRLGAGDAEARVVGGEGVAHLDAGSDLGAIVSAPSWPERIAPFDRVLVDSSGAPGGAQAGVDVWVQIHDDARLPKVLGLSAECLRRPVVLLPPQGWGRPRPELPVGACRLRLDVAALARAAGGGRLPTAEAAAVARLARFITDHTVGVALGGGGAWGYAHVALLRALRARDVPIDVVSGASFGSVVGAYYCRHGLAGLDRLVAAGPEVGRAVTWSVVSSAAIERLMEREVPGDLEDLDTVFLPVATNVSTGKIAVLRGTSIAHGVRASSSFPLAFAATVDEAAGATSRLVDGGIVSNVPDSALLTEGADFLIAANVVPPPRTVTPRRPRLPGRFGRWVAEANPLARVRDGVRSAFILMHAAGEADASLADVLFNAEPLGFRPNDFASGREIINRVAENVERTADQAARKWRGRMGRR